MQVAKVLIFIFKSRYRVRLGEYDRSKENGCDDIFCSHNKPEDFYIQEWTIHPDFNITEPTLNDIAIIKLGKNVTFNGISTPNIFFLQYNYFIIIFVGVIGPVCLPEIDNPGLYEASLEVTGWAISGNCKTNFYSKKKY